MTRTHTISAQIELVKTNHVQEFWNIFYYLFYKSYPLLIRILMDNCSIHLLDTTWRQYWKPLIDKSTRKLKSIKDFNYATKT